MSSKIIGSDSDFFANLVVDAVSSVRREKEDGRVSYPVNAINVLKSHGMGSREGFALDTTRAAQGMPRRVENAKIALLDFNLRKHRMALGVQILVRDPKKLEQIRQREADITKEKIMKIINAGANVILTTKVCFCRLNLGSVVALTIVVCDILLVFPSLGLAGCVCLSIPQGIDDLCMKYLVENGVIGVRRVKKDDLQRVASATGGVLLPNLSDLEGEESFDPACLGEAAEVSEERVGDGEMLFIRGCKTARATTILLRGANEFMLEEMERGGAVEAALSVYLDAFATTLGTREQLAIKEFAEALLVIPKTLAVNAAQDATDLVAQLSAYHHESKSEYRFAGLFLIKGKVVNNMEAGVLEPAMSKVKSLRFATEAAITVLRIDDWIKINPKEENQR
ncbi:CCT1 [Symbiodinium sp. KB8]|nr:CCT1 [Symbiodinium sp. KB8]